MDVSPAPENLPEPSPDTETQKLNLPKLELWLPHRREIPSTEVDIDDPVRAFFAAQIESAMCEIGIASPQLCEYLTELLITYMKSDSLAIVSRLTNGPIRTAALLLAEDRLQLDRAEAFAHCRAVGDYALFSSGVYPQMLTGKYPHLSLLAEYESLGRAAYEKASTLTPEHDKFGILNNPDLFLQLGEDFPSCRFGLNQMAHSWQAA